MIALMLGSTRKSTSLGNLLNLVGSATINIGASHEKNDSSKGGNNC